MSSTTGETVPAPGPRRVGGLGWPDAETTTSTGLGWPDTAVHTVPLEAAP